MVDFPRTYFRPLSERWWLQGVVINGGTSVGGSARVTRTDGGGLWMCEQTFLLTSPQQRKIARAFSAQLDGGAATVDVPFFVGDTGPFPAEGSFAPSYAFADPAAVRSTSLTVGITIGLPIQPGDVFAVTHTTKGRRKYVVHSASEPSGEEQAIVVRPPLRQAVTTEALDFMKPSCRMRLMNPDEFIGAMGTDRVIEAKAVWMESFDAS